MNVFSRLGPVADSGHMQSLFPDQVVEKLNMRNFMDITDSEPSSLKNSEHFFPIRIQLYFIILFLLLLLSLLLVGLVAWHTHEVANMRKDLNNLRFLVRSFLKTPDDSQGNRPEASYLNNSLN